MRHTVDMTIQLGSQFASKGSASPSSRAPAIDSHIQWVHLAVAQKTGTKMDPCGNMLPKACGLPLRSFHFEPPVRSPEASNWAGGTGLVLAHLRALERQPMPCDREKWNAPIGIPLKETIGEGL